MLMLCSMLSTVLSPLVTTPPLARTDLVLAPEFLHIQPGGGEPLLGHLTAGECERSGNTFGDLAPALHRQSDDACELPLIVDQPTAVQPHREQDAAVSAELLGRHVRGVADELGAVGRHTRELSHSLALFPSHQGSRWRSGANNDSGRDQWFFDIY